MLDAAPAKSKAEAKGKGKAKAKSKAPAKKRSARVDAVRDSETESEDDEDDDMSDFIVEDDEDEEEKDERRKFKKALNKRKAFTILDSDEESADDDTPEEIEVLHGVRKEKLTKEAIKLMPRFLPSTKMKAMMASLKQLFEEHPDEKVRALVTVSIVCGLLFCYSLRRRSSSRNGRAVSLLSLTTSPRRESFTSSMFFV
jgi:hypothetical protein